MSFRHQYVIGDLQGCHAAYLQLLKTLDFDPNQDKLWFAGDLVARGEDSFCLLYTSPSPRDRQKSRMPSSA